MSIINCFSSRSGFHGVWSCVSSILSVYLASVLRSFRFSSSFNSVLRFYAPFCFHIFKFATHIHRNFSASSRPYFPSTTVINSLFITQSLSVHSFFIRFSTVNKSIRVPFCTRFYMLTVKLQSCLCKIPGSDLGKGTNYYNRGDFVGFLTRSRQMTGQ